MPRSAKPHVPTRFVTRAELTRAERPALPSTRHKKQDLKPSDGYSSSETSPSESDDEKDTPFSLDVDLGLQQLPFAAMLKHVDSIQTSLEEQVGRLRMLDEKDRKTFATSSDGKQFLRLVVCLDSLKHGLRGVVNVCLDRPLTPVTINGKRTVMNVDLKLLSQFPALHFVGVKDEKAFFLALSSKREVLFVEGQFGEDKIPTYRRTSHHQELTTEISKKKKFSEGSASAASLRFMIEHALGLSTA